MKRDLVDAKGREIVAYVVVAVAVLLAQIAGQRIENAKRREGKQATIRYFVEAMTIGVISAQRQTAQLLGGAGLQAGIVAARIGAEFIYVAKACIERLVIRKGSKAAITHRLVPVELHLV